MHIRCAAATLNQTALDWTGNISRIVSAIDRARQAGATHLCLPELSLSGPGAAFLATEPAVASQAWQLLHQRVLPVTEAIVVTVGLPILGPSGQVGNGVAVLHDQKVLGIFMKSSDQISLVDSNGLLFWPHGTSTLLPADQFGGPYPIGTVAFQIDNLVVAPLIYNPPVVEPGKSVSPQSEPSGSSDPIWLLPLPSGEECCLTPADVDLIMVSASHVASFAKPGHFYDPFVELSSTTHAPIVVANSVGNSSGTCIAEGGSVVVRGGAVVAQETPFSFQEVSLLVSPPTEEPGRGPAGGRVSPAIEYLDHEYLDHRAWETLARHLSLGLFDYLRKSRSKGFVLSLSGGADSGCVAAIVRMMVRFATEELGLFGFVHALSHIESLTSWFSTFEGVEFEGVEFNSVEDSEAQDAAEREIMKRLLTCVYQKTDNSSQYTQDAAQECANGIGATFLLLDIQPIVDLYTETIASAAQHTFSWQQDDIALQNIQARSRAPSAWMIANVKNAILLATGNRSEAAVGYATMDGDTAGGLGIVGSLPKSLLSRFLRWLHDYGPLVGGKRFAIPSLAKIISHPPTAELRPPDRHQTDEKDLMPYVALDRITELMLTGHLPIEIFTILKNESPDVPDDTIYTWIQVFFQRFSRNQWKRERLAPGFTLDVTNLEHFQFPILNGGFQLELQQLASFIAEKKEELL